jgi:hypothetical protein
MRLREPEMPLDPEVERELAAIEAGLAGLDVEPELADLAELASEARGLGETPEQRFAARLDERAAEGFAQEGRLDGLRVWLAAIPPRRALAPAAVAATLLVAVGVGISELGGSSSGGGGPQPVPVEAPSAAQSAQPAQGGGKAPGPAATSSDNLSARAAGGTPSFENGSSRVPDQVLRNLRPVTPNIAPAPPVPAPGNSGLVPRRTNRVVESNAQLTLGAASDQVPDVANGVIDVTHRYQGIVVSSQVTHGDTGARASFDLAIPSTRLPQALADLSDLAHVQSSSEGSIDITAPTVAAQKRLAEAAAHLASLRRKLAAAVASGDTARQAALERGISTARVDVARAHSSLHDLRRRAGLARVSVAVTSEGAGTASSWTFGDALHDAGRVLTVTAGVLLVTAAVAGPLALLALLAWLAARSLRRWQRERSLDARTGE